jgi:hypothetical protein
MGRVDPAMTAERLSSTRPPTQGKGSFALQCNKGVSSCKAPEPGSYIMVHLPKNWGAYDCVNVDLYSSSADPATSQKIGEYCLIEK